MKRLICKILIICLLLAINVNVFAQNKDLKGIITLSGAWALYPMAVKWADEFQKIHPGIRIDVQAGGAGKGMADALAGMVDIGMISRDINPQEIKNGAYPIAVVKDAVVPTVNENNPVIKELLKNGVTRETFLNLWITGKVKSWGQVSHTSSKAPVHLFARSDACGAAETWAAYLGKKQEDLTGIGVYGDPGIAETVRNDPLGIGFNNVNYAYDSKTAKPVSGLKVIPIDINGNGKIDNDENFYETREKLNQAIVKGIFPSPPARNLFFVTKNKPEKKILNEFIGWILTDGQKFVPEAGYITLSKEILEKGLKGVRVK